LLEVPSFHIVIIEGGVHFDLVKRKQVKEVHFPNKSPNTVTVEGNQSSSKNSRKNYHKTSTIDGDRQDGKSRQFNQICDGVFGYQQQLVPRMRPCGGPMPNFFVLVVQQGQRGLQLGGRRGTGPMQQNQQPVLMMQQQATVVNIDGDRQDGKSRQFNQICDV
ncbi:hypothetical protein Tco_1012962, partial [Tanacetum coccineum]